MPAHLAATKCPSSCTKMSTPRTRMNARRVSTGYLGSAARLASAWPHGSHQFGAAGPRRLGLAHPQQLGDAGARPVVGGAHGVERGGRAGGVLAEDLLDQLADPA